MRFLTVAERELRAAARRKGTYRTRWVTAAVFLGLLVWLTWLCDGFSKRTAAVEVFQAYSVLTFIYCIIIGTAVTADCLSCERREGTLGLLFLTNLNSAEIVAGKFCSTALSAVYGLMAIFPMLALPLLMGGITLQYFWKTILALVVTIFFSMACGFAATTICRRQFTAIALAMGLAFSFGAGLMGAAAAVNGLLRKAALAEGIAAFCPLYTLLSADGARVFGKNHFWSSVLAVAGVALVWLALATWRLSRSWRDQPKGRGLFRLLPRLQRRAQPGSAGRLALRRRLLNINPFFWLGGRKQISSPVFMGLVVVLVAVSSYVMGPFFARKISAGTASPMVGQLFAWLWTGLAIHLMTAYLAAMVASQRLAEDKQTGALELILSTPTSEQTISRGLWLAYGRRIFFPALVSAAVHFFFVWQCLAMMRLELPPNSYRGLNEWRMLWSALFDFPLNGRPLDWQLGFPIRCVLLALALLMVAWVTLGWVGRWLGLRMKHPGFAPVVALAWVYVPPVIVFSIACYLGDVLHFDQLPDRQYLPFMMWLAVAIAVGHCVLLSGWAWRRLRRDFRTIVMNRFQPESHRRWRHISLRSLLRFGMGLVTVVALLALVISSFYGYQNWRSRRHWAAFQREIKQQGGSLDLALLLPESASDGANFARTPAFKALVNDKSTAAGKLLNDLRVLGMSNPGFPGGSITLKWSSQNYVSLGDAANLLLLNSVPPGRGMNRRPSSSRPPGDTNRAGSAAQVLQALAPHEVKMRALAEAARLPFFQISTNRTALAVLHADREELQLLEQVHFLFQLRSCAQLGANHTPAAAEDLLTCLRLAGLARQATDTRSSQRAQTMLAASLQSLWEGLVQHQWIESQLAAFQQELAGFNFLADYTNAVQRAVLAHIEVWRARSEAKPPSMTSLPVLVPQAVNIAQLQWQPRAWWLADCIQLHQAGQHAIARLDAMGGRVGTQTDWSDLSGLPLDSESQQLLQQQIWSGANPMLVSFAQNAVNQAVVACALERYFLTRGKYPDSLEELQPAYLGKIPNDPIRGRPVIFQRVDDRHYILRGVGPNELDDRKNRSSDDWLWAFPTNAPAAK